VSQIKILFSFFFYALPFLLLLGSEDVLNTKLIPFISSPTSSASTQTNVLSILDCSLNHSRSIQKILFIQKNILGTVHYLHGAVLAYAGICFSIEADLNALSFGKVPQSHFPYEFLEPGAL